MNKKNRLFILIFNIATAATAVANPSYNNASCTKIYQNKKLSLFEFANVAQKKYPSFHRKNLDYKGYIRSGLDNGKMLLLYTIHLDSKSSKAILINKIFSQATTTIEAQWAYTDILRYYQGQLRDQAMNAEEAAQSTQRAQEKFKEIYLQPLIGLTKQLLILCDPANPTDVGLYQTVLLSLEEYSEQDSYRLGVGLNLPKINNSRR